MNRYDTVAALPVHPTKLHPSQVHEWDPALAKRIASGLVLGACYPVPNATGDPSRCAADQQDRIAAIWRAAAAAREAAEWDALPFACSYCAAAEGGCQSCGYTGEAPPRDLTEMVKDCMQMIVYDGLGHVTTFEELHETVDANMYVSDAIDTAAANDPTIPLDGAEWLALCNDLCEAVHSQLPADTYFT